ncbi:uncharacterized protein [Nicotiana tomentosiformis]|uniref:uncharacterized protein n=1 Tax=Nicotiana tomentosiformis TaxID=4098 RepID=UPI00388C66CB
MKRKFAEELFSMFLSLSFERKFEKLMNKHEALGKWVLKMKNKRFDRKEEKEQRNEACIGKQPTLRIQRQPADECEQSINVTNIVHYYESYLVLDEIGTDCSDSESKSDSNSGEVEYDSDELQIFASQKKREIMPCLDNYKELYKGMRFKNIPEARKYLNLYALANKKELKLKKSSTKKLRYRCVFDCPFVIHITPDEDLPEVRVRTLKAKHTCDEAFKNSRVDYYTIANYFKKKVKDNPKFKIKEMRVELKNTFNVNVSYGKCKRAKRPILEKLDGSFIDDYNRLEAYANELRVSNPVSDVVINLSKDTLSQDIVTRPTTVSESKTRLLQRQKPPQPSSVRVISFTGDTNGVSPLSSLPFKPPCLKWKGKSVVTRSQLEMQSKKKVDKLKPRRGSN